jgi:fibronectin type 3 domain-containing protein
VSGELRSVPLKWDPVLAGDVAGYVVERALAEGSFGRIAVVPGRFATAFVDEGTDLGHKAGAAAGPADLGDGASYSYRVRAFDPAGRLGKTFSTVVTAATAAPPATPVGLHVYGHQPREIALTWEPVTDPTVSGYRVYRSPSTRGPFEVIARVSGRFRTTYTDAHLGDLRVFYYRVAAVNAAGGVGEATPPARALTKPEPLSPANLHVAGQRLGANRLAWDPNVERDLTGYKVFRLRRGGAAEELVATLPTTETSVEDTAVAADEVLSYTVAAIDADGLESARARPIEVTGEGYALRAEVQDGAVHLHWTDRSAEGFVATHLYRKGTLRLRPTEIARVPSEGFVDRSVEPGGSYRYFAVMERGDGTLAPPSATLEVRVPE